MVVVHHIHYSRVLVLCRGVVVPTITLLALPFPYAAGYSLVLLFIPRLYAYYISHLFVVSGELQELECDQSLTC